MTGQDQEREWLGTGHAQEVANVPDRLEVEQTFATKAETHLWIATVVHRVADQALDKLDGNDPDPLLLDTETMLCVPLVGCYVCMQPYSRRLRHRKCPGEPS